MLIFRVFKFPRHTFPLTSLRGFLERFSRKLQWYFLRKCMKRWDVGSLEQVFKVCTRRRILVQRSIYCFNQCKPVITYSLASVTSVTNESIYNWQHSFKKAWTCGKKTTHPTKWWIATRWCRNSCLNRMIFIYIGNLCVWGLSSTPFL